jgi:RNA recognition motif-containing protein
LPLHSHTVTFFQTPIHRVSIIFSACRTPRGFAYVKYSAKEEAVEAVAEMNNFMMEGRVLHVTWAAGGRKSSDEMRNMMPEPRGGGRDDRPRRSRSRDRRDDRRRSRSRSRDRCVVLFLFLLLRPCICLSLVCPSIITTSLSGIVAAALVRARAAGTKWHRT